jgi:hypothetical protein
VELYFDGPIQEHRAMVGAKDFVLRGISIEMDIAGGVVLFN